jgi:DNA-directed RNA polymerase specialized sigma subunit
MFIMKNHVELLQKISFVKSMIYQFEDGLNQIGEGHEEAFRFQEKINEFKDLLTDYEEIRDVNIKNISELEGLDCRIAKMRYIDGSNYKQIAEKLGKSHDYIRTVASATNKREREFVQSITAEQPLDESMQPFNQTTI